MIPWGRYESDTTEQFHFPFSLSCVGEGNGNPLQCSCLENPRAGGAWWAAVYGVAQSQTRLKRLSSSSRINTIHGILKARILEWVAFPFSRRSSQPRNQTGVSCIGRRILGKPETDNAAAKSLQSGPTLCDPIDGSPPGSPGPGILQARTLEWVAISFSKTIPVFKLEETDISFIFLSKGHPPASKCLD